MQNNCISEEIIAQKIETVIEDLRPMIHGHGGDITFVRFEKGIVYVRLHGACTHCPISFMTLKMGIEEQLKKRLPEVIEVAEYEE